MAQHPKKANVSAQLVKELRDRTGAGFTACREALLEAGGDIEQAINVLRKKGQAAAAKKAQRATSEGSGQLLHSRRGKDRRAGGSELRERFRRAHRRFSAPVPRRGDAHRRARSALSAPRGSDRGHARPRAGNLSSEQAKATGKPEAVVEKIVNGKMEKFYEENCLYEQHFIRDEGVTIKELVDQAIAKVGENITIRRFSRFKVGEMDGSAATAPPRPARRMRPIPASECSLILLRKRPFSASPRIRIKNLQPRVRLECCENRTR